MTRNTNRFTFIKVTWLSAFVLVASLVISLPSTCDAQIGAGQATAETNRYTEGVTQRWQVGAVIQAGSRPATSIDIAIPVPTDWPEQVVSIVEEDVSAQVRNVKYQILEDGVKRMTATIPRVPANSAMKVLLTFEVQIKQVELPEKTDHLIIPKRPAREIKRHLNSSFKINHRKNDIKKLTKELSKDKENPWDQVKAFYDWIQSNVRFADDEEIHGAVDTFKKRSGNGEDMVNLFVAMCRAHKVPSRFVWADGTQYAEFYLEDEEGEGAWFPVQPYGVAEFGKMSVPRVIQQKGDNIKVPEKGERQRFVVEIVTGETRGAKPKVTFVRRLAPEK